MARQLFLSALDTDTGEITEIRKVKRKGRNFYMAGQQASVLLAKDNTLHGTEYKVLLYLAGVMDYQNQVIASQSHIARELGMKQPQVSEAINKLVAAGAVTKINVLGTNGYYVDAAFALKGTRTE